MTWAVLEGDCLDALAGLDDASVDAVVTDPPYGIGFMGHAWDQPGDYAAQRANGRPGVHRRRPDVGDHTKTTVREGAMEAGRYDLSLSANQKFQSWTEGWAREALRVLKPGGHLICFASTRTYHRMASGVEDAGFEIRDCIAWMYGSGFPKSLDVSKAIDSAAGAERTVPRGVKPGHEDFVDRTDEHSAGGRSEGWDREWRSDPEAVRRSHMTFEPATPGAELWEGWGTALKPAYEPIVVARKPLSGTVAATVLEHGTGALNIDGCRIEGVPPSVPQPDFDHVSGRATHLDATARNGAMSEAAGRWPANVALDPEAGALLDEQTGEFTSGANSTRRGSDKFRTAYGDFEGQTACDPARGADSGGASRFFYCAKASSSERNAGLVELPTSTDRATVTPLQKGRSGGDRVDDREFEQAPRANVHPTVKPIDLMRWLVRLVTPPGGIVLDPFNGSGTTGIAAVLEGFDYLGCEREAEYVAIADARLAWWAQHAGKDTDVALGLDRATRARESAERDAGQTTFDMFDEAA